MSEWIEGVLNRAERFTMERNQLLTRLQINTNLLNSMIKSGDGGEWKGEMEAVAVENKFLIEHIEQSK